MKKCSAAVHGLGPGVHALQADIREACQARGWREGQEVKNFGADVHGLGRSARPWAK